MPNGIKIIIGAVVLIIAFLFINPIVLVGATEKGLMFNWGALSNKVLDQGVHFRWPVMQKVKNITIQPIKLEHIVEVGDDGAITKDNQTIGAEMTIFYKYDANRLPEMWQDYGERNIQNIIMAGIRESFKSVIGEYDIFLLPTKQEELRNKTLDALRGKLTDYPISITEFKIVNYDWSEEFDKQIAETMNKAQEVKQKEQELLITEQESQKKVKIAEATKQALITEAEGKKEAAKLNAEAKALEGEGIEKYNNSVQKNMALELELRRLEIDMILAKGRNGVKVPEQVWSAPSLFNGNTNLK